MIRAVITTLLFPLLSFLSLFNITVLIRIWTRLPVSTSGPSAWWLWQILLVLKSSFCEYLLVICSQHSVACFRYVLFNFKKYESKKLLISWFIICDVCSFASDFWFHGKGFFPDSSHIQVSLRFLVFTSTECRVCPNDLQSANSWTVSSWSQLWMSMFWEMFASSLPFTFCRPASQSLFCLSALRAGWLAGWLAICSTRAARGISHKKSRYIYSLCTCLSSSHVINTKFCLLVSKFFLCECKALRWSHVIVRR